MGVTGTECFNAIAEELCRSLGADCVIVGKIAEGGAVDEEKVHALAMILDGKVVPEYEYALKGTPCENVSEKGY